MNQQLQETEEAYRFSVFRLDVTERCLWADDEQISLTPKQFDLLAYFVKHAGRIAKKSELLDAIWADAYVEEATLARNVSWLRSKLEEHSGGESLIETVPKLGYRFTAAVSCVPEENDALTLENPATQTELIEFTDSAIAETTDHLPKIRGWEETSFVRQNAPLRRYPLIGLGILLLVIIGVAVVGSSNILTQNPPRTNTQALKTEAQAPSLRVKATITIKNIAVDATQAAIDVGIKVLPGDSIMVGAEGLYQTGTGQTWTVSGDTTANVAGDQTFQQAAPSSLVAWIGTTEADKTDYFQVSKGGPVPINKSGSLYLAVNDRPNEYADNRGGLQVMVTLARDFEISAETDDIQAAWGTELVRLHKDDTFAITSTGTVSYWSGGELYDLNGSQHKLDGLLAPLLNARCLIGKIGSRNPFKIGLHYPQQKVVATGWLFLSVNDQITRRGAFKNNTGNITVGVDVARSPEVFTTPL